MRFGRSAFGATFVALAVVAACGEGGGAVDAVDRSAGVLDFDVSVPRVRAAGWAAPDATDAEALLAARDVVQRRLDGFDLGLRATVDQGDRTLAVHGTNVLTLERRDAVASYLSGLGSIEILLGARAADIRGLATLDDERQRFVAWRAAHPAEPLANFHALAREDGGPHPALLWTTTAEGGEPVALALPDRPERAVAARDLSMVHVFMKSSGDSELYLRATDERSDDLDDLARQSANRSLAVLLEGELFAPPTKVSGRGSAIQITGAFDPTRAGDLTNAFHAGRSPLTAR